MTNYRKYTNCDIPVDIYGRGNKRGYTPTIKSAYTYYSSGDECLPDFDLLPEVEKWLKENIGKDNYCLSSNATEAYIGLWSTIWFRTEEDAMLFSLTW